MANKNVMANAYKFHSLNEYWTEWNTAPGDYLFWNNDLICERFPTGPMRVSRATISVTVTPRYSYSTTVRSTLTAKLYKDDPETGTPITFLSKSNFEAGVITFDFTGLSFDVKDYIYIAFELDEEAEPSDLYSFYLSLPSTAAMTYTNVPALNPSIVQPRSGNYDASNDIIFSWQLSGVGTQTKAALQWSLDGVTWKALRTVNGGSQSCTIPGDTFPAGRVYWQIQITSSYGILSNWAQANFTAVYAGATVTLTTPTSGSRDGGEQIQFVWSVNPGAGSIVKTILETSSDDGVTWETRLEENSLATDYTADAGLFAAGALKWRVTAYNQYQSSGTPVQASFTVTYSATSQVVPVNTPTSGIINTNSNRTFTVALNASGVVHTPFTVSSATFYWRHGQSGGYTAVTMTPNGNTASAVISAGTFTTGILQWYASATDNTNTTTETEVYTLTVLNADIETIPLSPINTVESGSSSIVFSWEFYSIDGSQQSAAEIRYSTNGVNWTVLPRITGNDTRFTVSPNTFTAGTIYWQVRAYNDADIAGDWSASVSFVVFAAPIVQSVIGDGKPFLTISWQVDTQQAYEIYVNGKTYGPYFGENVRSYHFDEPLPDGSYTIRVRVQNRYGLWSEWTEGNVSVTNVSNTRVIIFAHDGVSIDVDLATSHLAPIITEQPQDFQTTDTSSPAVFSCGIVPRQKLFHWQVEMRENSQAQWTNATSVQTSGVGAKKLSYQLAGNVLSTSSGNEFRFHIWDYRDEPIGVYSRAATFTFAEPTQRSPLISGFFPPDYGYFLVYRDGELIRKTYEPRFDDRTVLGEHVYDAVQTLQDGYYAKNASVLPITGTASVECNMIAPLDGGDFIPLDLSDKFEQNVTITRRTHTARPYYSGSKYSSVEIGEQEELSASFGTFWIDGDDENASVLEAMKGKPVILKLVSGIVIIGVLDSLPGVNSAWRKAYTIAVSQMEWEDFADDT